MSREEVRMAQDNGMLRGFLEQRRDYAWMSSLTEEDGQKARIWVDACVAYGLALEEYDKHGDTPKVKIHTEMAMNLTDEAIRK
jgi:hypothetical protein